MRKCDWYELSEKEMKQNDGKNLSGINDYTLDDGKIWM